MTMQNRLDREWMLFEAGPSLPFGQRLTVSLNRRGIFLINPNLHRKLGKPAAMRLYYHPATQTIAMQPAIERQQCAFPLKPHVGGYTINAAPFCAHFGIRTNGTERFTEPEIDASGTLKLDLTKTILTRGGRKPRKTKAQT
jgi:hypothetical protein